MRKITADFISGLNRDTAKTRQSKSNLYFAENIRITTEEGASTGSIVNTKGNLSITINNPTDTTAYVRTGYTIVAHATILNDILLFYINDTLTTDDYGNDYTANCIIDILKYTSENVYTRINLWEGAGLNFRIDKPITIISRYETANIIKIYWSDGNEGIRVANIAPDSIATNLLLHNSYTRIRNSSISNFNRIANFTPNPILFLEYQSGKFNAGIVQYAYRLYNINGNETLFSPTSSLIPISDSNMTSLKELHGMDTSGQAVDVFSNKSILCSFNILSADVASFDRVEIVSLFYTSDTDTPEVKIISRVPTATTITFLDDGGTAKYGTLSYAEFLDLQIDLSFKTAEVKDNILFIGNLKEEYFDLDIEADWIGKASGDVWDARAFRFAGASNTDVSLRRQAELYEFEDTYLTSTFVIDGSSATWKTDGYTINGAVDIPETADCINVYNNIDYDETEIDRHCFAFKADGTTVGGEGINLYYTIDSVSNGYTDVYGATSTNAATPTNNYSSIDEYALGSKRSFQQDEIYRFGIVFYDLKGRRSFVKWIGDIRMPITQMAIYDAGYVFRNTTPLFTITNIPEIDGNVLSYQIVYVKRESQDKTVLSTGIAGNTEILWIA